MNGYGPTQRRYASTSPRVPEASPPRFFYRVQHESSFTTQHQDGSFQSRGSLYGVDYHNNAHLLTPSLRQHLDQYNRSVPTPFISVMNSKRIAYNRAWKYYHRGYGYRGVRVVEIDATSLSRVWLGLGEGNPYAFPTWQDQGTIFFSTLDARQYLGIEECISGLPEWFAIDFIPRGLIIQVEHLGRNRPPVPVRACHTTTSSNVYNMAELQNQLPVPTGASAGAVLSEGREAESGDRRDQLTDLDKQLIQAEVKRFMDLWQPSFDLLQQCLDVRQHCVDLWNEIIAAVIINGMRTREVTGNKIPLGLAHEARQEVDSKCVRYLEDAQEAVSKCVRYLKPHVTDTAGFSLVRLEKYLVRLLGTLVRAKRRMCKLRDKTL